MRPLETLSNLTEIAVDLTQELGVRFGQTVARRLEQTAMGAQVAPVVRALRTKLVPGQPEVEIASAPKPVDAPSTPALEPVKPTLGRPDRPAQLFGRRTCPWSGRARRLLQDRDIDHDYSDLDADENRHLEGALVAETDQHTVPYVYLRGEFLGGFNALSELDRIGQLDVRLMTDEERATANPMLTRVEVAARPVESDLPVAESVDAV